MQQSPEEYTKDYGFEAEMVRYRSMLVQERLEKHAPGNIIELGCGMELQARRYFDNGGRWDSWSVFEPSSTFAGHARQSSLPNLTIVEGFFEDVSDQFPASPDFILCSGLLHEVPDSGRLIAAIRDQMGPDTLVHINVPNAASLHRRLAQSMGLINNLGTPSKRNTTLDQPRIYDRQTLTAEVEAHGLDIVSFGGHLLKPFTHAQMEPLVENLGHDVMDGLYQLGRSIPEIASEIFIEAKLK